MNPAALLGLIGDLYAQIAGQNEQLDRLRVENARLEALLPSDNGHAGSTDWEPRRASL